MWSESFSGPTQECLFKIKFCIKRNSVSHTCLEIFDLVEFQFVWPTLIHLSSHTFMWSSILPSPLKKYVWHYSTVSQEKTKIIGFLHSFPYTMNVFKQIASEVQIECVMGTKKAELWSKESEIFLDKSSNFQQTRIECLIIDKSSSLDNSSKLKVYKSSVTSIWRKFIKPQMRAERMYNSNWAWRHRIC